MFFIHGNCVQKRILDKNDEVNKIIEDKRNGKEKIK